MWEHVSKWIIERLGHENLHRVQVSKDWVQCFVNFKV